MNLFGRNCFWSYFPREWTVAAVAEHNSPYVIPICLGHELEIDLLPREGILIFILIKPPLFFFRRRQPAWRPSARECILNGISIDAWWAGAGALRKATVRLRSAVPLTCVACVGNFRIPQYLHVALYGLSKAVKRRTYEYISSVYDWYTASSVFYYSRAYVLYWWALLNDTTGMFNVFGSAPLRRLDLNNNGNIL